MIALPRPHGLALAILAAAFALTAASPAPHARARTRSTGLSSWSRGFEANVGQAAHWRETTRRLPHIRLRGGFPPSWRLAIRAFS